MKTKYPLSALTVVHKDQELLEEISRLEPYLAAELNVKTVRYNQNESDYIEYYAKPNAPVLGKRLGKGFKAVKQAIENLSAAELESYQDEGQLIINGETLSGEDILVFREAKPGTDVVSDRFISIDLPCQLSEELIEEGLAREVVNRVQKTRKDIGLKVTDRIILAIEAEDDLYTAIQNHADYIKRETLAKEIVNSLDETDAFAFEIDGKPFRLGISKVANQPNG
ncbi:MAG: DUF5915 domain-containing protein [Pseudomonadota bacterium]